MWVEFGEIPEADFHWEKLEKWTLDEELHVWGISLDEMKLFVPEMESELNEEELLEAKKMRQRRDYLHKIISRWWRRYLLSRYLKRSFDDIQFSKDSLGKISIKDSLGVSFSVSHAGNWVFLIFSINNQCGIDIEELSPNSRMIAAITDLFHQEEKRFLASLKGTFAAFYELWTRKEALLKSIGLGLNVDISKVNCLTGLREVNLTSLPENQDKFQNLSFRPDEFHVGSIHFRKVLKIRFFNGKVGSR
jgi:4'-phosphopantetheinyl transferase